MAFGTAAGGYSEALDRKIYWALVYQRRCFRIVQNKEILSLGVDYKSSVTAINISTLTEYTKPVHDGTKVRNVYSVYTPRNGWSTAKETSNVDANPERLKKTNG